MRMSVWRLYLVVRGLREHKEFELHCDNLALCWLFRNVKDFGRLSRWIIRLALYTFRVYHTKGTDNVVDDSSRMFQGHEVSEQEGTLLATMQVLTLVYASLEEHQKEDPLCTDMSAASKSGEPAAAEFRLHNSLYQSKGAKTKRYVAPAFLRPMLLKYFHDSPISGHMGPFKTLNNLGRKCYWPRMIEDIFGYVRQSDLRQTAKPAQNIKVGLHLAIPASYQLERVLLIIWDN